MFYYYGSKSKIAKYYPKPKYDLIIEPFAGAGWYSLLHNSKNVLLNEKYETIYKIWKWVIESANEDFLKLNNKFFVGQDLREFDYPKEYKDLLGFIINRGSTAPRNVVTKWSCQKKSDPQFASTVEYSINRISKMLPNIKHWRVSNMDYTDLDNVEATWFIDPPYQKGGGGNFIFIMRLIMNFYRIGVNVEGVRSLFVRTIEQIGFHSNH